MSPKLLSASSSRRRALGHHGAELAGRGEERGGLRVDHLEIGVLAGLGIVGGGELHHLALGERGGGVRQDAEDAERAVGDRDLERPAEQEVADQHARLVAPHRVRRRRAAAERAVVDHVVVQQRRGMDELDAGREVDVALARVAAEPGGAESEHRPQPLAAGGDDVRRKLGNEHHRALHVVENDAVHGAQVIRDQPVKLVERGAGPRLAPRGGPPFERHNRVCHRPSRLTARPRKGIHALIRHRYTSICHSARHGWMEL